MRGIAAIEVNAATRERNRILMVLRSMLPESDYDAIVTAVREPEGGSGHVPGRRPSGSQTAAAALPGVERRAAGQV